MDKIVILDYGSQYTQLIARRIRELQVYCEIWPYHLAGHDLYDSEIKGIIISGSPYSVTDEKAPRLKEEVLAVEKPILGICYGMQLLVNTLGGKVVRSHSREYGKSLLYALEKKGIFENLGSEMVCWMSHGDSVKELPEGFTCVARTDTCEYAAVRDQKGRIWGIQFHPEVSHTPLGQEILANFVFNICGCAAQWTPDSIIKQQIQWIRSEVESGEAVCALSGGVDSVTAAVLTYRAIGNRLNCIFVNNGLLRKGESEQVLSNMRALLGKERIIYVDARERFLKELRGVLDPEEKRKIIGRVFVEVFEEEAKRLGEVQYLLQGTTYPDVIESVSVWGPSARIKTHHNVGGLPEHMKLTLIEPLKFLFKDEVRKLALELGIPEEIVWRQPFPGPGLAVRIVGEVTEERLEILRDMDAIINQELEKSPIYKKLWQSFGVLVPVRSVGVMGDERTYKYVGVLRAVMSEDGMTADWARISYDTLDLIARRVVNEVAGIGRMVYDITSKPPATIEWE
ncbi:MAG: glutamine-hydrolyzing GMP synthase [Candidatus Atribacteria bacterium]|nr:glutamine-hydrolyzing GMP synthase [Candidatus Atribacteria bacterium]